MSYSKVKIPSEVYHLTKRKNAEQILKDGKVMRFGDSECWFCRSIPDLLRYMEYTVFCEGKPYIDTDGSVKRYPPFVPEEYRVLKLTPRYREGNWYQWNQEIPPNSPPELVEQAKEFSRLKIGFRGDLRFKDAEVLEVSQIMKPADPQEEQDFEKKVQAYSGKNMDCGSFIRSDGSRGKIFWKSIRKLKMSEMHR